MIVYFLRHASAGEGYGDPKKDEKRPLDEEGILQCRYVGRALAGLEPGIEVVISSPLKRATQTASLVANEMGFEGRITLDDSLRPEATYDTFRTLLQKHHAAGAIMVVGHNPSLTSFLGRIISSRAGNAAIDLKKGAVAKVDYSGRRGELQWLLTPKVVRTIYDSSTKSRPKTSRK